MQGIENISQGPKLSPIRSTTTTHNEMTRLKYYFGNIAIGYQ